MSPHLEPIPSIGTRPIESFDGPGLRLVYPDPCPEAVALRGLRESLALSLRPAARAMGIKPSQLSALEGGRARLVSPSWVELMAELWGAP